MDGVIGAGGAQSLQLVDGPSGLPEGFFGVSLLPEPAGLNDPMAQLEMLMVEMKLTDKRFARESKLQAERAVQLAVNELVKEMEEKADVQMYSAVAGGLGQIVSGGSNIGGGLIGGDTALAIGKGLGDVMGGTGNIYAGYFQAEATALEGEMVVGHSQLAAGERNVAEGQANEQAAAQEMRDLIARIERILQTEQAAGLAALFRA